MREDVVNKIVTALTPMGIPVYVWRVVPFQLSPRSELPAIVVMDTVDEPEDDLQCEIEHRLNVDIVLFVNAGNDTVTTLRQRLSEMMERLKAAESDYPLQIVSTEIDVDHDEQIVGRGKLALVAKYITRRWEL